MKTIKYVCIMLIALVSIMGCSGNYGKTHTQSESDAKATQQELIDNWADYNVYFTRYWREPSDRPFKATLIVFNPKNSDRKIIFQSDWNAVENQEMWQEIVNANVTIQGNFAVGPEGWTNYPATSVTEIWGPDNQIYGLIIHPKDTGVGAYIVAENTMKLSWSVRGGGSPAK